jgi:hypothetical protein
MVTGVLSGWSQGDFVPLAAHRDLGLPDDGSVRAIITPYSCVMAQAEPGTVVDLLLVSPANEDAGNFFGKSLRKINLQAESVDGKSYFEATPAGRRAIEAQYLNPYKPDHSLRLTEEHLHGLSYWLAQRFLRVALPTDFNNAWGPARKGLRKLAKRMAGCLLVLLMQRETAPQRYALELILVLDDKKPDQWSELQEVAVEMEKLFLGCERIDSVNVDVRTSDSVSLRDYREWSHFDAFDDISMAAGHAGPANHAHGALAGDPKRAPLLQRLRWAWIIFRGTRR